MRRNRDIQRAVLLLFIAQRFLCTDPDDEDDEEEDTNEDDDSEDEDDDQSSLDALEDELDDYLEG